MRTVVAIACLSALAGCAAQGGGCAAIGLVDYDQTYQTALAKELTQADPQAEWPNAVADYRALRESVRDCQEKEASRPGLKLWP